MKVICPYCNKEARLVTGDVIYPHREDLYEKYFYLCSDCYAYVGCHPETEKPLGRLADAELRKTKMFAHKFFDAIWKSGKMRRKEAYNWLADKLKIKVENCHIGMFDVETCKRVIEICNEQSLEG